jgi:ketosteroid isomerase-like protein
MSQRDVEHAREGYAALNDAWRAGDPSLLQPILEAYWDPDVLYEPAGVLPDASRQPRRGWDAVLQVIGGQMEAFTEGWFEASEIIDRGDHLIVLCRYGGRARHTGLQVQFSFVQVLTLREGKVVRFQVRETMAEALEAAGLSE